MDKHVIDHTIPKEAEGTYYTLPFPVPAGLERVTVSYSYTRLSRGAGKSASPVNIVDIGLMDGDGRFLGWSGSARNMVFVGPYAATEGYLMTDIAPGEWHILVGAYRIPPGGLTVRYEIGYTPQTSRWLTGDLHMHSTASDGQHDIYTLTKMALKAGLDFIAVANHNNYSENFHLPVVPGLTLIPAVEWTHYRGHMNFFGVNAPFDNSFIANNEEEMRVLIAHARAKGALISVNHPKCKLCPYLWQSEDTFDCVEVWNSPMRGANIKAIRWWHGMLTGGRKLPLIGGSDYHKDWHPVRFARPVTRVYAETPAADTILAATAQGHSYVTTSARGISLGLNCGTAMMGDTAIWREGMTVSVQADRLPPGVRLKLVTSEGTAAVWKPAPSGVSADVSVAASWRFAYLVAALPLFGQDYVRAISNPIYFSKES